MSFSLNTNQKMKPTFIELPTPSAGRKQIWGYFDKPDNPDNYGFTRCNTCYVRFPSLFSEVDMVEHLKCHEHVWARFFEGLESKLNNKHNRDGVLYNDKRKQHDLKLSNGIHLEDMYLVIRLPKSRTQRVRYLTDRWEPDENTWNKIVAEEYQNNQIGSHQGNFDRPISDKKYRCGNTLLDFSEFVTFRHEPVEVCKVFDVNRAKYKQTSNKDKINAYFIANSSEMMQLAGPATTIDLQRVIYSCIKGSCIFPCICKTCVLSTKECQEHEILHPHFFDPALHFFTVRNADDFNINVNEGKITYSSSLEKGYEMIYDVYKYAGIFRVCFLCSDDIFHHQAFHLVYHDKCKFCRASRHRIDGIRTHVQFLNRFEERRYKEEMSCHVCYKVFSTVQAKDNHVKNIHENREDNQIGCEYCENIFHSKAALWYHVQRHHEARQDLQCKYCDKSFIMKQNLDVHVKSVHNYNIVKCDICEQSFSRQSNLTCHYKYVHDVVDNYLIMDDGLEAQYFECEECAFESRYEKVVRRHTISVHNNQRDFKCTECEYVCNRMDNLSRHIKTQHGSSSDSIHSCKECDYSSKFMYNLNRHVKNIHSK